MAFDHPRGTPTLLTRRELLGFSLAAFLLPRAATAAVTPRRARSVILVVLEGGMSQLETWDPKPNAPREIRGEFGTIASSLPGVRIGEYTPLLARELHRGNLLVPSIAMAQRPFAGAAPTPHRS